LHHLQNKGSIVSQRVDFPRIECTALLASSHTNTQNTHMPTHLLAAQRLRALGHVEVLHKRVDCGQLVRHGGGVRGLQRSGCHWRAANEERKLLVLQKYRGDGFKCVREGLDVGHVAVGVGGCGCSTGGGATLEVTNLERGA
jgi:hypothetical protein